MEHTEFLDIFQRYEGRPKSILFRLYRKQYWRILVSALCYIVKHSAAWMTPILVAQIITALTTQEASAWDLTLRSVLILFVLVLLNIPFNYLHVHFRSVAMRTVESQLRSTIIEKLQLLTIPYHNDIQSGKLQSKMIRDVEAVQTLSEQFINNMINISINIIVALTVTAISNRTIFVFFLFTVPIAALTIRAFRRPIEQKNRAFRMEMEKTSAEFIEMESLIEVTRAHALEDVEKKRLSAMARQVADEGYRLDIIQANFGSISWAIFQVFQLMTLVFSAYLTLQGSIPVGNLVLYQTYFTTIVNQVTAIIALVPMLTKGLESVSSIAELLNSMEVEEYKGKSKLGPLRGEVVFDQVDFSYKNHPEKVIKGLSLHVKPGETVAFVGGSGSGKTTTMNLLIGFLKPTHGKIYLDGMDTEALDFRSFRSQISVVPQNPILFTASIRDNISYGLKSVSDKKIMEILKACSLEEFIRNQDQGLDALITEGGANLSGGQRQRLSIARALIRDPKLIILDEATSALDSISEKMVLDSLEHLIEGRTAFIVAHRISTIKKADKICVLDQGRIVEMGNYESLMAQDSIFAKMQNIQKGIR